MKRAFTLLEMLVVVLIIGILAAVSYPQYRVAVWRARVAKLLPLGRNIAQQVQLFYDVNGYYPTNAQLKELIPDRFQYKSYFSEELQEQWAWYENGNLGIHCADGSTEPTNCRFVSLSLKEKGWSSPFILFFNAKVDPTGNNLERHSMLCGGIFIPTESFATVSHQICRSLGGKPTSNDSFFYYID